MTRAEAREAMRAEARRYVKRKVGENPKASNRGNPIDAWLWELDVPLGQPWCSAAATQDGVQAVGRSRYPFKPTASVPELVAWAKANGCFEADVRKAAPGDLLVLYYPSLNRWGHVAVLDAIGPHSVTSFDGNSNDDGSREGWQYVRKERPITANTGAVIWPDQEY